MQVYKKLFILSFVFMAFLAFFGSAQAATLSQTSVSLYPGQSSTVYASNFSSTLYIGNNSNSGVATVSIIGSTISIYGIISGSTTATICETNTGICTPLYITVSGSGYSSGALSLSQTSLTLSIGQTSTVTAYNNNYGTLYVSSNSNQNVATVSVSGNIVSIYGTNTGSSTISICQSYGSVSCGTVYVSVTGYGYTNGYNGITNNLGLNISSMTMSVGGSITISPSNYTSLYVSNNSNPGVASALVSSLAIGCTANAQYSVITGQPCFNSGVSNYYNNNYNTSYIPGCYANAQYSITTGQPCYNNNYSTNNNSSSVVISALAVGSDTINLCQTGGTCNTIYLTVNNYYSIPVNNPYNYYGQ